MLELKDVNAFYGKSHVLHGVTFKVGAGEIVSLLGRNGSGRSTTVKAIMGLVVGAGSIRWQRYWCIPSHLRMWWIRRMWLVQPPR